jgi:2-phospho-L-lactate transferase/gluconeogenesis factor (CofD/UPF0052 family)
MRPARTSIRICLFCGGRGSSALIRSLLRRQEVELTLLVNAYDDGLSTGALRGFIPGMLGPSDFRKNLSYLLDLYSTHQYALQQLFEFRLPAGFSAGGVASLRRLLEHDAIEGLPPGLGQMVAELEPGTRARVRQLLAHFFTYFDKRAGEHAFDFDDCSFGNLVFAGAFLEQGNDFNKAARLLAEMAGSRAQLVNVSVGEDRKLAGLKADGELLANEASIVGAQSAQPILETFFLGREPDAAAWRAVADQPVAEKLAWLRSQELPVAPSAAAIEALQQADIIIYGPGTQHSSLLPSYRIAGEAILASPARIKAFVVNLREDHDIRGLGMTDLVDNALRYLGDPENARGGITHVLYNAPRIAWPDAIGWGSGDRQRRDRYKAATIVEGEFENPAKPTVHSGMAVIGKTMELFEGDGARQALDIYVDLAGRARGIDTVVQELLEIPWARWFRTVALRAGEARLIPPTDLPEHLSILPADHGGTFPEVTWLYEWLFDRESEYLVTITGDGEYHLSDILLAQRLLGESRFGAVYGSRTQSRRQFHNSLRAAYGEGGILFRLSWLGAFLVTALLGLRLGIIFSDPLTGFRVYRRSRLGPAVQAALRAHLPRTPIEVTKLLIINQVEIAEMPVHYRTFAGFTQPHWRFRRGLKNLLGVFS